MKYKVIKVIILVFIAALLLSLACGPPKYTLKTAVVPEDAGTITPASGKYVTSTDVTIAAIPASGYTFDNWSGDATGTTNSITIKMDSNKRITAHFKTIPTYAEVIKTYPPGVELCDTEVAIIKDNPDTSSWWVEGTITIRNGVQQIQCYGAKVTLKVAVTIDGKTYPAGTKLTVDKDLNWIEVSSWDLVPTPSEPASAPQTPSLTSVAPNPEIPSSYTTYTDDSELFSISYPSDLEAPEYWPFLEEEAKSAINEVQSGLPLESGILIFAVVGPMAISGGFYNPAISITVKSIPEGLSTIDQIVDSSIAVIKTDYEYYKVLSRLKTTTDGREAIILDYEISSHETGKGRSLKMTTLAGKTIWIVTCVAPAEDFVTWENDFNTVVRSLRISD